MKHILMLTTGGTIASADSTEGLAPRASGEILSHFHNSVAEYTLTTRDVMSLDSTNIQPEEWGVIATAIDRDIRAFDGIVVTHGTDTMAYTASMMSFMLRNPPVPVVFTGSQVPIAQPLTDAVYNLLTAFEMASSGVPGVYVAFDRKIILGCRAVKVRTTSFDAFESVNCPYAGVVSGGRLRLNHGAIPPQSGPYALEADIDPNVFLLKLTPGSSPDIIDMLIDSGCRGIVIEAFGSGGIQFVRRDFTEKLDRAYWAGVPVVVCSQCLYESSDFSIYQTGQRALQKGAIEALDMTSEAAVTKLMWALGKSRAIGDVRRLFKQSLAGEITLPQE